MSTVVLYTKVIFLDVQKRAGLLSIYSAHHSEDNACIVCGGKEEEDEEGKVWMQSNTCMKWIHEFCLPSATHTVAPI